MNINLAKLEQAEMDKVNVDLAAAGVARRLASTMIVLRSEDADEAISTIPFCYV